MKRVKWKRKIGMGREKENREGEIKGKKKMRTGCEKEVKP